MIDTYDKAMNQAMYYLGAKMRTAKQMEEYLTRKQHGTHTIARVMEKLIDYHYIDDSAYAHRIVEVGSTRNGALMIRQKLKLSGISDTIISGALAQIDDEAQVEAAHALLTTKLARDECPNALRRAMQATLRRGFSYDVVRKAAGRMKEEVEPWQD